MFRAINEVLLNRGPVHEADHDRLSQKCGLRTFRPSHCRRRYASLHRYSMSTVSAPAAAPDLHRRSCWPRSKRASERVAKNYLDHSSSPLLFLSDRGGGRRRRRTLASLPIPPYSIHPCTARNTCLVLNLSRERERERERERQRGIRI